MNIMLASVIERTHEIGIRRTVGATRRDVTLQFLMEALMMTLGGGAAGIAIGALVSLAITTYAGWATHVSVAAVLLGLGVSFVVGLVFGVVSGGQGRRARADRRAALRIGPTERCRRRPTEEMSRSSWIRAFPAGSSVGWSFRLT